MEESSLIDPACGSGNFLIYAFTVFYDLYVDQMENYDANYSRREIPKLIVENNLYGVDLDERAIQITQIALFIKARQLGGRRGVMPQFTHVVSSHFVLPEYSKVEMSFMLNSNWDEKQQAVIRSIWNDLRNAYKFGSLIRIEEQFNDIMPNDINHSLFATHEIESLFSFKQQITTNLRNQVAQWSGEGSNSYTVSKTNDAITFLEILSSVFFVSVDTTPYTVRSDFCLKL